MVSDIPAGDGNIANLFYSVTYCVFSTGTGVYAPPELLLSGIYSRAASTAWSLGISLTFFYSVAYYIFSTGTGVYAPPELLLSGLYSRTASTAWSLGISLTFFTV